MRTRKNDPNGMQHSAQRIYLLHLSNYCTVCVYLLHYCTNFIRAHICISPYTASMMCLYVTHCLYSLFCSLGYQLGTNLSATVAHSICEAEVETLKIHGDRQVQLLRLPNKEN